jgi:uncharacterized membrane protein
MKTKNQYAGIRWTARVVGTLLVLFTLFIVIGEMIDGYHKNGKTDLETFNILLIITFIFWFFGLAGMILAWWKEGAGGILSFICTVIFLILVKINANVNPEARFTVILFIFLIPSVLFIIYWWLTKKVARNEQP